MDEKAVAPLMGVLALTAITVVMASTVLLLVHDQGATVDEAPRVAFQPDFTGLGGTLTVAAVDGLAGQMDWSQVSIADSSTAACTLPEGPLHSGNEVRCSSEGDLSLVFQSQPGREVLIYQGQIK